jgi:hypothetical protein
MLFYLMYAFTEVFAVIEVRLCRPLDRADLYCQAEHFGYIHA